MNRIMLELVGWVHVAKDFLLLKRPIVVDRQELLFELVSPFMTGRIDLAWNKAKDTTADLRRMSRDLTH